MNPHNIVAFHHHRPTDSNVDIVESNLNSTNGNLSAVAAAAVQTSATASNNFALSQRLNLMAATIFANSNNHSNTAAVAAAAANSAFPFLSSSSSVTATPIERISPAIVNSNFNGINSVAQFHSAAQSFVQQQPQVATAAMAAAAAAALAHLPSIAAAAAAASAASASSASTNNATEYVAVATAAAQQAANVNNVETLETLNDLQNNIVYPTNFSSYLEQNIQNSGINASSVSTIAQQYALISSPFCTTASFNQLTCPMHRFVSSNFTDNDDNSTFSMLNTQRSFSFLNNNNNNNVRQNSIQNNLQQTAQQRFLLVDNSNNFNRQYPSNIVASRLLKRNALQMSNNTSQSLEQQNNRVLTESLRNQNGNNQLLSTVIIPTSSSLNNNDDLRSRILEDSSRLLTASSSRAPKLRRINSIDEDIVSANSSLQAVATNAFMQLQRQQQQTQGTNTILPFDGSVPNSTLIQSNQQHEQHRVQQLQHVRSIINNNDNVVTPLANILQQNLPSSTAPSSVTLEQFMAAINAATLPSSRGLTTYTTIPQSSAIVRPSSVSQTIEPSAHCAICYQSIPPTLIATPAAVTGCNCMHHHHHYHPQTICTICQQQTQLNSQQQQQQNQQHSVVAAAVAAFQQQQSIGHFVTAGATSTAVRHSPTTASAGATTLAIPSTLINIAASLAQQTQNVAIVAQQNSIPASHFSHINRTDLNPMHTALLANRYAQQERDQQSSALFYRQQQQNQTLNQQQPVITSPLIMVEQHPVASMMGLSMLVFRPSDTATLVLNGAGATQASVVHQHAAVAAAAAAAAAVVDAAVPEPQPVGVTSEQIKKYSSLLNYTKDPKIPEQERDRCTVCLIDFETDDKLRSLHCSHLFHIECIDRWLIYNKKCPVCRVDMDKAPAAPVTQPFISVAPPTAFS